MSVGAVLGGLFGAMGAIGASQMSGSSNRQANLDTISYNHWAMEQQMKYNTEMYERQLQDSERLYNERYARQLSDQLYYNSPGYKMKTLQNAGLNPYLAMSGGAVGSVQSSSPNAQTPSALGLNVPGYQARATDYSGLAQGLTQAAEVATRIRGQQSQNRVMDAQSANLRVEGQYIAAKAVAELARVRAETKSIETKNAIDKIIQSFVPQMQQTDLTLKTEQINQLRMGIQLNTIEYAMQSQRLAQFPTQLKLEIGQQAAQLALLRSQKRLTDAQVRHEAEKMAETIARTYVQNRAGVSAAARAEVDNKTIRYQIGLIEQELIHAANNSGADNPIQGSQNVVRSASEWWKSLYPF